MKLTKPLKMYCDPGHGWVAVKVKLLRELQILANISSYSYLRGQTAYLEEDCDAQVFVNAYREKYGDIPPLTVKHQDKSSTIRSYDRYDWITAEIRSR